MMQEKTNPIVSIRLSPEELVLWNKWRVMYDAQDTQIFRWLLQIGVKQEDGPVPNPDTQTAVASNVKAFRQVLSEETFRQALIEAARQVFASEFFAAGASRAYVPVSIPGQEEGSVIFSDEFVDEQILAIMGDTFGQEDESWWEEGQDS